MTPANGTEQFRNIHAGKKCFVCGAGVSIGSQDLSGIHAYPVICVNSSILLMPWNEPGDVLSRFWISTDSLCMQWDYFWKKVGVYECTRVVRNSWSRSTASLDGITMHFYIPRKMNEIKWKEEGLMAGSSILSAIDLALLMGCKKVILLGVDHVSVNGNSHFWQNWPLKDRPIKNGKANNFAPCQLQQGRVFKTNIRSFDLLKKYSETIGATIFNASPVSVINSFERISLEEAIRI